MSASLFDNAVNYAKNNPIETALTVASVVPAVRIGKFAYTTGKTLLKNYKTRPHTLYRGVPDKQLTLTDAKKNIAFNKIDNKVRGTGAKTYGNWFTTDKTAAKNIAGKQGNLYKVKIDHKTLLNLKTTQPKHYSNITKFNKLDREFYGIVTPSIRRQAKKL